jgi:hypothetical protein
LDFGYVMSSDGEVETHIVDAQTFDIHIERLAVWWSFYPRTWRRLHSREDELEALAALQSDVEEASDRFGTYFLTDRTMAFHWKRGGAIQVFDKADAAGK